MVNQTQYNCVSPLSLLGLNYGNWTLVVGQGAGAEGSRRVEA